MKSIILVVCIVLYMLIMHKYQLSTFLPFAPFFLTTPLPTKTFPSPPNHPFPLSSSPLLGAPLVLKMGGLSPNLVGKRYRQILGDLPFL